MRDIGMRRLMLLILFIVSLPSRADACSRAFPAVEETAKWAGEVGFLIRGRVIQTFNASEGKPEIIRAEEIYIGERGLRDFVIYHPKSHYVTRPRANKDSYDLGVMCPQHVLRQGEVIDRLLLKPSSSIEDTAANGQWDVQYLPNSTSGAGLDLLVLEAEKRGRLVARPQAMTKR